MEKVISHDFFYILFIFCWQSKGTHLVKGEYFYHSCCVLKGPKGKSKYKWLNIVELKMECSEVHTKMNKVQYSSVYMAWVSLVRK